MVKSVVMMSQQTVKQVTGKNNKETQKHTHTYRQLILDKGAQANEWRKDCFFNKWLWNNWVSVSRKKNIEPYLIVYIVYISHKIDHRYMCKT